jgi:hypothetical protein
LESFDLPGVWHCHLNCFNRVGVGALVHGKALIQACMGALMYKASGEGVSFHVL